MDRDTKFRLWVVYRRIFQKLFGFAPDIYMNAVDRIHLGEGVLLGPGCCIVTARHDLHEPLRGLPHEDVYIGDRSWVGAHAVILPGVRLGPHTIVGAGAVVTRSFPEGHVILVGAPAKVLRKLDSETSVPRTNAKAVSEPRERRESS